MTTTDANGIVFLEETDPISPFHTLMNTLQQGTSDAITDSKSGPAARFYRNTNQAIGNNSWGLISGWSETDYVQGGVSLSGASAVVPVAGVYLITADAAWPANGAGRRGISISLENSTSPSREQGLMMAGGTAIVHTAVTAIYKLPAGGRVSTLLFQDSGGTLTLNSIAMSLARVA